MKTSNRIFGALGLTLYFACALFGIIFFAVLTWANLEGNFYFGYSGNPPRNIHMVCPHIVTPQDPASISAILTNPSNITIRPFIDVQLSGQDVTRDHFQVTLEAGKNEVRSWRIGPQNVAFGHLILAEVYQNSSYDVSAAMNTCGSLYLNLPSLTGERIYFASVAITFAGMLAGLLLWYFGTKKPGYNFRERTIGLLVLLGLVIAGVIFGSLGIWIPGVLTAAIALVLYFILLGRRFSDST